MLDAAKDRRGVSNVPLLIERNENQAKQCDKDKFHRVLTRGASGFLREMQDRKYSRKSTRMLGVNTLTKDMVVDGLSGIGKHPISGRHALLDLNLKVNELYNAL